ncbi:TetR/AcrR family transcriptional regulator [Glutamicibacter creatinolyticus]|uniref:TetR/AcrR family transcriptional regulator n=1 Tax=Glutamicibacter creatinolyticus TaxID=162496 RepID=UPI0037BEFEF1
MSDQAEPANPPAASSPTPRRGRPRDAARDQQILTCAQQVLAEQGFAQFTMDEVAARIGASKATVYRRWSSRTELLAAAISSLEWNTAAPDTGSLREDLIQLTAIWFAQDPMRDAIFVNLLAALPSDEQLHELYMANIATPRAHLVQTVVEQARARGELGAQSSTQSTRGILPAMVFHRLVVERRPVDRAYVERVVDEVILPAMHHQK